MGNRGKKQLNSAFGGLNIKRCMMCALLGVAVFPVMLVLAAAAPGAMEAYLMPGAFYTAGSGAFAYLMFQIIRTKAKNYYNLTVWCFLVFMNLFLSYFGGKNILFYYGAVLLSAYVVFLPVGQYVALTLGELTAYAWIMMLTGKTEITVFQLVTLLAVHLFSFVFSREQYMLRRNYIIEERKLKKEQREAEHDPLTGLMNRRGLERRVEKLWNSCIRNRETVAVFVMDIDHFKSYNDCFGHVQGDSCIRRIARCIEDSVQECGLAARIGGEEFLVFVRGENPQAIYETAEQVRRNVEDLGIASGRGTRSVVTISIGVDITCADEDTTLQALYGRADKQLYLAKQEGRNCVRTAHFRDRRISKIV